MVLTLDSLLCLFGAVARRAIVEHHHMGSVCHYHNMTDDESFVIGIILAFC